MSAGVGTEPRVEPVSPVARHENIPLAIMLMVGSGAVFTCSNAATKWLVATYPIGEVLFTRTLVSLIFLGAFILPTAGLVVFRTRRIGAHLIRAGSQGASQTMLAIAFTMMPLAGVTAIMFSSPIFTTLASIYFLHERVGAARWAALLIGFLGVLVIAAPGADSFQVGALFALGNAILFGTVVVGVRGMTATESTGTLIMYQLSLLTIVYAVTLPFALRHADRVRCADHDRERARKRRRAICLDARDPSFAGVGRRAVPVSPARLGDAARLRGVGRPADRCAADRIGDRDRVRAVPVLAREPRVPVADRMTDYDTHPAACSSVRCPTG